MGSDRCVCLCVCCVVLIVRRGIHVDIFIDIGKEGRLVP